MTIILSVKVGNIVEIKDIKINNFDIKQYVIDTSVFLGGTAKGRATTCSTCTCNKYAIEAC